MLSYQQLLVASLAVSAVSITVGRSKLTDPWRAWLQPRTYWGHALFSCPYCLSHWFALVAAAGTGSSFVGYLVNVAAVVGGSAIAMGLATTLLHWDRQQIDALEDQIAGLHAELAEAEGMVAARTDENARLRESLRQVLAGE